MTGISGRRPDPPRPPGSGDRPAPPRRKPGGPGTRGTLSLLLLLSALALPATRSGAGDDPFTFPSNTGLTGLLEVPTARVMPKDTVRAGFTRVDPYRYYFLGLGLFDRLEVGGRITEVDGVPGFEDSPGYGDFKDKAVDVKLQIVREGKYAPAVAAVFIDPIGTRIYGAEALVASKQVFPFDFTVGLGNGRLGDVPPTESGEGLHIEMIGNPKKWWRESRLFGGIQFAPSDRFALLAEYCPVSYERQARDPAQPVYFTKPVPSRINVGLRWKPFAWAEVDASWQRGNEFGFGISTTFGLARPFVPIHDPPWRERPEDRRSPLEDRIAAGLSASGFSDVVVAEDGMTLRIEARNDRYFFAPRAFEAALGVLAQTGTGNARYVRIILTENGVPVAEFVTTDDAVVSVKEGTRTPGEIFEISSFRTDRAIAEGGRAVFPRRLAVGIKPSLDTFLNDPSAFISYRLGVVGWVNAFPWTGGMGAASLEWYPFNTVTTSNEPLSNPVRSDIALYKDERVSLGRLLFDQVVKFGNGLHGRAAVGYLEVMYAGIDGEVAVPVADGRVFLGAGGSVVRKREPDAPFDTMPGNYYTAFLNSRLNIVEWGVAADVQAGRFLAGDWGARLTLSKFVNGCLLSAWYSVTDTSVFTDEFNRGYHDKGISLSIPLRMFLGHDSRETATYKLAAWTRDAGQDIEHYRTLFDFIGRNTPLHLDSDRKALYSSIGPPQ